VYARRLEIDVEVKKENTMIQGDGPYKWANKLQ
jgi:hypothetical protein